LPSVIAHLWGAQRNEYGSWVRRCPCGLIHREIEGKTEYWRWKYGRLEKLALPPPHPERAA
jgi:hypothetical protein